MVLRTLGGLRLEGSDFTRPQPLLLLAYLALEGPKERGFLSELFWLGARDPRNRLSAALSRLRGVGCDLVEADDKRVWTELGTDATRLLSACERGDYERIAALYAGPFLTGVTAGGSTELEEWIFETREFLAGRVRETLLTRAEREAASRAYEAAARDAEAAYRVPGAAEPYPEELARLHPLLLAGGSAYATPVREEVESYGVTVATSPEAARERLNAILGVAGRARFRLPVQGTPFVGREIERKRILERLRDPDCRLLTLVAPGGMGKTRLALAVAEAAQTAFEEGVCFVPLGRVASPEGLADGVARALGLALGSDDARTELLRYLRSERLLLVMDNVEHLLEGVSFFADVVREAPGVTILATSRERLKLRGEWLFELRGLTFPADPADPVNPAEARRYGAVRLFERVARRVAPDFRLSNETGSEVARICRLVEGMPLALELAAGWIGVLPLAEIRTEIERGLEVLETQLADAPERHRSVRAVFETSWQRLDPETQAVLAKLSVFAVGFDRGAAQRVAEASLSDLRVLVSASFLSLQEGRYEMHGLVRQFSRTKLANDEAERFGAERRHARHFLASLATAREAFLDARQKRALTSAVGELPDLVAAWTWAVRHGEWTWIEGAVASFTTLCHYSGRLADGLEAFERAAERLASEPEGPPEATRVGVLTSLAWFYLRVGRLDEAERTAEEALERFTGVETPAALDPLSHPYSAVSLVAYWRGRYEPARAYAERLREISRSHDLAAGVLVADYFLGRIAAVQGDVDAALRRFERGYALAERQGDGFMLEFFINELGRLALQGGDVEAAGKRFEAFYRSRAAGSEFEGMARGLKDFGRVALLKGELREAERLFERSVALYERVEDPHGLAEVKGLLASVARRQGDLRASVALLEEALMLLRSVGTSLNLFSVLLEAADLLEAQGRSERAREILAAVAGHASSPASLRTVAEGRLGGPVSSRSLSEGGLERIVRELERELMRSRRDAASQRGS